MEIQLSILLRSPCKKCQNKWGELRETNQVHAAGIYCKNCGTLSKWVGNGEQLDAVITVGKAVKVDCQNTPQLPKVPKKLVSLKRAIALLGHRVNTELRPKTKKELIDLVGTYPTSGQAKTWKELLEKKAKKFHSETRKKKKRQKRCEETGTITGAEYMNRIGLGHLTGPWGIFDPDILSDGD